MFDPEFGYLLVQEEVDEEMTQEIDHMFSLALVCVINLCSILGITWIVYKIIEFAVFLIKYSAENFWIILTPGNEVVDILFILFSIVVATMLFVSSNIMGELLDKGFTKLKDTLNEKDERIKELEDKILVFETRLSDETSKK